MRAKLFSRTAVTLFFGLSSFIAGADDIDDGINSADFVEMDFFWGHAVDFAFGARDPSDAKSLCPRRHGRCRDYGKRI